jgi:hypothetical protein
MPQDAPPNGSAPDLAPVGSWSRDRDSSPGTRRLLGRVLSADTFRDGRLRLLRAAQEADIRRSRQKMQKLTGAEPRGRHVRAGNVDLDIGRYPWAFSPAPFGSALLALVPTVQPMPARCKHRPRVDDDPLCPQKTVDVHYCLPVAIRPEIM